MGNGISLGTNFDLMAQKYLDSRRSFDTIAEMKAFDETSVPDGFVTYVKETDLEYQFKSSNTDDAALGKWRKHTTGSGTDSDVKIYTDLSELSLTKPTTVGDIFNAMASKSILMLNVDTATSSVTDVPVNYGLLLIEKYSSSRFSIIYKLSMSGDVTDNKMWIGQLKGADGSGLVWDELCSTSKAINSIELVDAIPTGSTSTDTEKCLKLIFADSTATPVYVSVKDLDGGSGNVSFKDYAVSTAYKIGDLIVNDGILYEATTDFTSGTDIETDITVGNLNTYLGHEVVDNLTTKDSKKGLSANQGYVLSQMFLSNITFNSLTKEVEVTAKNGTKTSYSIKTFIDDICKTLAQGKAISCDELPTCAQDADGNYIVTYKKDGVTNTNSAENTWFYYYNTTSQTYVQTLFVAGTEITMKAGAIGDVITINSTTKNWEINSVDTCVRAEGYNAKITENADNTSTVYKLDITNYDETAPRVDSNGNPVYEADGVTQKKGMFVTETTPNLRGADGVILDNAGMFGLRVENNQLMLYANVTDASTADGEAPPFSLEHGNLYYTVGGTIQYVSKETVS